MAPNISLPTEIENRGLIVPMGQDAIEAKIQRIVSLGIEANEDEVRSLAVLVRKRLETTPDTSPYLTLNLFCTWAVHIAITNSTTGLKTVAMVNDALVKAQDAGPVGPAGPALQALVGAVGFKTLRAEFTSFLDETNISHRFHDDGVWRAVLRHLIEIIRDVPIAFPPPIPKVKPKVLKIYEQAIHEQAKKPGAGVIRISISDRIAGDDNSKGRYLVIETEDARELLVPLLGDV